MNKEARYYDVVGDTVYCYLCPHLCVLKENKRGICKVRFAKVLDSQLKLVTQNYGEITSLAVDPIEKKPLASFYPGHTILSIGSFGCNFTCSFCQNFNISQVQAKSTYVSPNRLVEILDEVDEDVLNNLGIAFTYNEPSIWYEYVLESSKLIKTMKPDKKIVVVTNGFINEEPLNELLPYVDAFNIDLKGDDAYYRKLCTGRLEPVMKTIKCCFEAGKHIEITTLLVQDENTEGETIEQFGDFISSLSPDIPLHLSRYFPNYKMSAAETSLHQMKEAYQYLSRILTHVHLGNVTPEEKAVIMAGT